MKNKMFYLSFAMAIIAVILSGYTVGHQKNSESECQEYGSDWFIQTFELREWEVPTDFTPIDCDLDVEVQQYVYYMCQNYNIDFGFAMAVIKTESDFHADQISMNENNTKDYGLMQINECNHKWMARELGVTDFLDPYQNINAGMYVLYYLFQKYDGEPDMVLMAYNMGESGAQVLWNQGIYETEYTKTVNKNMEEMQEGWK